MCNEKLTREDEEACAAFHNAASDAASRIYVRVCRTETDREGGKERGVSSVCVLHALLASRRKRNIIGQSALLRHLAIDNLQACHWNSSNHMIRRPRRRGLEKKSTHAGSQKFPQRMSQKESTDCGHSLHRCTAQCHPYKDPQSHSTQRQEKERKTKKITLRSMKNENISWQGKPGLRAKAEMRPEDPRGIVQGIFAAIMMSLGWRGSVCLFGQTHTKICLMNTQEFVCLCVCVRNIVSSKNIDTKAQL